VIGACDWEQPSLKKVQIVYCVAVAASFLVELCRMAITRGIHSEPGWSEELMWGDLVFFMVTTCAYFTYWRRAEKAKSTKDKKGQLISRADRTLLLNLQTYARFHWR